MQHKHLLLLFPSSFSPPSSLVCRKVKTNPLSSYSLLSLAKRKLSYKQSFFFPLFYAPPFPLNRWHKAFSCYNSKCDSVFFFFKVLLSFPHKLFSCLNLLALVSLSFFEPTMPQLDHQGVKSLERNKKGKRVQSFPI